MLIKAKVTGPPTQFDPDYLTPLYERSADQHAAFERGEITHKTFAQMNRHERRAYMARQRNQPKEPV